MKPLSLQRKAHPSRVVYVKKVIKRKSLHRLKADALLASVSGRNESVEDVREAFGFFPKDVQGVVIHWPAL